MLTDRGKRDRTSMSSKVRNIGERILDPCTVFELHPPGHPSQPWPKKLFVAALARTCSRMLWKERGQIFSTPAISLNEVEEGEESRG